MWKCAKCETTNDDKAMECIICHMAKESSILWDKEKQDEMIREKTVQTAFKKEEVQEEVKEIDKRFKLVMEEKPVKKSFHSLEIILAVVAIILVIIFILVVAVTFYL